MARSVRDFGSRVLQLLLLGLHFLYKCVWARKLSCLHGQCRDTVMISELSVARKLSLATSAELPYNNGPFVSCLSVTTNALLRLVIMLTYQSRLLRLTISLSHHVVMSPGTTFVTCSNLTLGRDHWAGKFPVNPRKSGLWCLCHYYRCSRSVSSGDW